VARPASEVSPIPFALNGVPSRNDAQFFLQTSADSMYIFHIGAMSNVDDNGCSVTAVTLQTKLFVILSIS
jgi:hypothetical protein